MAKKNTAADAVEKKPESEFTVEMVKITRLKKFPGNPRTMSREMMNKLMSAIEDEGFVEPLVIDEQDRVIGGHQRLYAARKIGMKLIPCHRVDLHGDEQRAKLLNLRLNKLHGEFDYDKLYKFIEDVDHELISATGFDADEVEELSKMMDEANEELQEAQDEAEERTRVEFDADMSRDKVEFRLGSIRAKVKTSVYDKANVLFETGIQKRAFVDEAGFLLFLIKCGIKHLKQL